jgi:tetratricopeptide (TPR) repeat protein
MKIPPGRLRPSALLLCLALFAGACSPADVELVEETDERQYQLAKNYLSQGRTEEALSAFLRVIDARRAAPQSHLEAGYLYLREFGDPVRAIYHFDRFLQFEPQSPQAPQVRQLIETAEKEFARQLPAQPYQGELDRIDLMELVKSLREENERLKRDLAAAGARARKLEGVLAQARRIPSADAAPAQGTTAAAARPEAAATSPDPSAVPEAYSVRPGDTLSSISKRFYGTPSRWMDIYQANRDRLASQNALKVGQELRIP